MISLCTTINMEYVPCWVLLHLERSWLLLPWGTRLCCVFPGTAHEVLGLQACRCVHLQGLYSPVCGLMMTLSLHVQGLCVHIRVNTSLRDSWRQPPDRLRGGVEREDHFLFGFPIRLLFSHRLFTSVI